MCVEAELENLSFCFGGFIRWLIGKFMLLFSVFVDVAVGFWFLHTIAENISSKILREALNQQREIQEEENEAQNPDSLGFSNVVDEPVEEEEDIDEFHGYDDSRSHGDYEVSICQIPSEILL